MAKLRIITIFIISTILLLVTKTNSAVYDPLLETQGWRIIGSKYLTIYCQPSTDIGKINDRIKIRFYDVDLGRYSVKNKNIEEQLAEKFDRILKKVEKILDMYPQRMKLRVKVFKNQAQLDDEYAQIFGRNDGIKRISFYLHKYTTIYIAEQTITEGVLAHEMGHAVADHHFLILPPDKIGEMLSQYVELHLED